MNILSRTFAVWMRWKERCSARRTKVYQVSIDMHMDIAHLLTDHASMKIAMVPTITIVLLLPLLLSYSSSINSGNNLTTSRSTTLTTR